MRVLIILLVLFFFSCSEKKREVSVSEETVTDFGQYINDLENNFPKSCLDSSSIYIWRVGSIQWSSSASVLMLKNDDASESSYTLSNAAYLMLNENTKDVSSIINEPIVSYFQLSFEKERVDFKLTHKRFVPTEYLIQNQGEGYCANQYFIKKIGESKMVLVNGDSDLEHLVSNIFQRISAQEHYQSLSLEEDCSDLDDIAHKLLTTGLVDKSRTYLLPYLAPIRHDGK